jgi:hypothetical protein
VYIPLLSDLPKPFTFSMLLMCEFTSSGNLLLRSDIGELIGWTGGKDVNPRGGVVDVGVGEGDEFGDSDEFVLP